MAPHITMVWLSSMTFGTILTLVSSHWLTAWAGLVINSISFVPMLFKSSTPRAVESSAKYFLVQALAASMVLFAILANAWHTGSWQVNSPLSPFNLFLLTMALALKMGMAPMHMWMPEVLQGVDLTAGLILSTWQKIAPFFLMYQLNGPNYLIFFMGLSSIIIGAWGGLNQTQLRKMLAYSSITHMGWILMILQFSRWLSLLMLLLYMCMTTSIFLNLILTSSTTFASLASSPSKSLLASILLSIALLSLAGMPPLTGFMPKWFITVELIQQGHELTAALLIPPTLFSLYFYARVSYVIILTASPNNTPGTTVWRAPQNKPTTLFSIFIVITAMMLPIAPTILVLFQ